MADEQPKRVRGQKEREAVYRQGFHDGVAYGVEELRRAREMDADRDAAASAGLAKLRRTIATEPKRRRRATNEARPHGEPGGPVD